jgi:DNA-binding MarR family transcriptional regulator
VNAIDSRSDIPRPRSELPSPSEAQITLRMLTAVADSSVVTQRSLARELGIALGLANAYLRRCVAKGLIKVKEAPARRYAYYLTPKGFSEKSRLTAQYLAISFDFFRHARTQYDELFASCERQGWHRIALCGSGDLAEIARLCADSRSVTLAGLLDPDSSALPLRNLPLVREAAELGEVDVLLVTDHRNPQASFDALARFWPRERILAPKLLNISRTLPELLD